MTHPTLPAGVALHAAPSPDLLLLGVVGLAALGSAVLLGLGLAVLARRRSQPYLLVVLALAALLARSLVAALGVVEVVPTTDHHVAEHSLDVAMAALVIGAVYYARGVEERARRRLGGRTDGGADVGERPDGGRTDGGADVGERPDGGRTDGGADVGERTGGGRTDGGADVGERTGGGRTDGGADVGERTGGGEQADGVAGAGEHTDGETSVGEHTDGGESVEEDTDGGIRSRGDITATQDTSRPDRGETTDE